jgi:hypothetical protein
MISSWSRASCSRAHSSILRTVRRCTRSCCMSSDLPAHYAYAPRETASAGVGVHPDRSEPAQPQPCCLDSLRAHHVPPHKRGEDWASLCHGLWSTQQSEETRGSAYVLGDWEAVSYGPFLVYLLDWLPSHFPGTRGVCSAAVGCFPVLLSWYQQCSCDRSFARLKSLTLPFRYRSVMLTWGCAFLRRSDLRKQRRP